MTKLTAQAAGTFAIAPTPFHDDGRIDEKSIDRLTDFYAEVGCDGVTVLGILGEAPKLDAAEAEQVAVRFVKRAKNMQIIVGVSAPGFATMRSLAKASMDAGAAGVMIAPPPHLRTDDQITGYFKQAQEAIGDDIPWVLQDYPLTLNVIFTPAVIRKIVMDSPSCVMLKHEDWPGLEKISTLRGYQKDGSLKPMSILVGNGGLFLDFEMERGADGAMTGYAFPELLRRQWWYLSRIRSLSPANGRSIMKLTAQAAGTFAIAPTPFHDDGRIDEKSIDRLTDFYAEVGCDGVTVLGILGEAPKLDAAEAEQVAVRFVKRAKNMQIIVGVSAPGFASMRSLAKASMDAGAAGVMIAPPPHLRTDDQITGYFKQAQEAIGDDIPWVLQDYPLTLNVIFTPAVIRKIVMDRRPA